MSLQRDLTPATTEAGYTGRDINEAFTIIHVVPKGGESYWMLLDYGTRAEHRIDTHYRDEESFFPDAFSYSIGQPAGFTHKGRAGSDGKIVYAKSLQAAIDHLNGQQ